MLTRSNGVGAEYADRTKGILIGVNGTPTLFTNKSRHEYQWDCSGADEGAAGNYATDCRIAGSDNNA
jgi:hypothetical protein